MSRDLTASVESALVAGVVRPAYLVEIETVSGVNRFWTGNYTLTWDSKTWVGTGELGQLQIGAETVDLAAQSTVLTLSGVPSSLVSDVLGEFRQDQPVTIYLAFLDASEAIIADPFIAYQGFTDLASLTDGGSEATIQVTVDSRLRVLQRACTRRYTDMDQQSEYPGDLGFEHTTKVETETASSGGATWSRSGILHPTRPRVK